MKTQNKKQTLKLTINKKQSGVFFVGDLCYTQTDNDVWRYKFVSNMFFGTKEGNEGVLTANGYNYFVANTGGDGFFYVLDNVDDVLHTYEEQQNYIKENEDDWGYLPVDAGCLGIIPIELVTEELDKLDGKGYIVDLGLDNNVDEVEVDFVPGEYFYFAGIQAITDINRDFETE